MGSPWLGGGARLWQVEGDALDDARVRLRVVGEELDRERHQQLAPGFLRYDGPELIV